jgi:hypothetical protein
MRRFSSFLVVISVALLTSICSAQQHSHKIRKVTDHGVALTDSALLSTDDLTPTIRNVHGSYQVPTNGSPGVRMPSSPDNWNGGTGNWSIAGNWGAGVPTGSSDVTIYSGGIDTVTLDVGSTTINSLTLGGTNNGTTSELTNGGVVQTLNITNALDIGQTGLLYFTGASAVSASTLTNNGLIQNGDVTVNGALTNNGLIQNGDVTVNGALTNNGMIQMGEVTVNGALTNNGMIGPFGGPGASLLINGALVNNGAINYSTVHAGSLINTNTMVYVPIDAGSLINSGNILDDQDEPGHIRINGDANNSGLIKIVFLTSGHGAQSLKIVGTLTNRGGFLLEGNGASVGSLVNSGNISLVAGSGPFPATLQVNGDVTNSGTLGTSSPPLAGGNTVTVSGMLINEATGQINLNGPDDVLKALGGLSNRGVINVNNASSIDPPFVKNLGTINIDSTSKFVVGTGKPSGLGYIQLANGTLGEMIAAANQYGVINVNGSALLAGTLDILLQGGFNPRVGSIFQFLFADPGQLSGRFDTIENDIFNNGTEQWDVTYDNGDGIVELVAEKRVVPEPATLLVLVPGLLGAGYGLRRKLFA